MAEKIHVTFLGTGSAIPTAKKNHPATLISYKEHNFLFDCGEGTQRQFRMAKLNPMKLTKIFVTHWHGDHTLGIPGLLQTLGMNGYNGTIEIHGPRGTKKHVANLISFFMESYLKGAKRNGNNFTIQAYEHSKEIIFENDEIKVTSFPLKHAVPVIGYTYEIKEKKKIDKTKLKKYKIPNGPEIKKLLLGKNITVNGKTIKAKDMIYTENAKKISYVLDTVYLKDIEQHAKNSNLLIIESTFLDQDKKQAEEKLHLTAKQAGAIAKKANVEVLAMIHFSQRYAVSNKVFKDEAKTMFSGKVITPKDLERIIL